MTKEQFVRTLAQSAKLAGGQRALARQLGISAAYLNDVLSGKRLPGPKILKPLGWSRVTTYTHTFKKEGT